MVKKEVAKIPNKQKEKNKSVSEDLLNSYRSALYKIKDFFDSIESFDMNEDIEKTMKVMDSILKCGEKLGKNIETLAVLEKKVQSEEDLKGKARGNTKIGLFEDGAA
jgi:hypothetical protein